MKGIIILKLKERETGNSWVALNVKIAMPLFIFGPLVKYFISFL